MSPRNSKASGSGSVSLVLAALLGWAGCGRGAENAPDPGASAELEETGEAAHSAQELAAVHTSLETGAVDEAAAELLKMQQSGRSFSPAEAAEYREALEHAYSQALEAARRGDPKGEAALKMIRATRGR